ncbi:protein S100-A13 isoform X1 [Pongo abelii]|uniref:protein S100-A13 isoform X1 n=1 Tax=Pongo abelii TaxID=9601 RepID=UPI0023E797A9|nr:protein S100-A13 isoform X1 [Pongo abelii]
MHLDLFLNKTLPQIRGVESEQSSRLHPLPDSRGDRHRMADNLPMEIHGSSATSSGKPSGFNQAAVDGARERDGKEVLGGTLDVLPQAGPCSTCGWLCWLSWNRPRKFDTSGLGSSSLLLPRCL